MAATFESWFATLIANLGVGHYTTTAHTVANVATVTTPVLAANSNRSYVYIVNDSDTVIYLAFGVAANVNNGIRLAASGGVYEMSNALGNLYTGAINGIHAAAGVTKNLLVTEGT